MKIDYAVMSSDDNPLYLDFWDVVSKLWNKLNITPVLLYFGEGNPSEQYGKVVRMKSEINKPIVPCWARYWWAGQQDEKVCIITDIDMLPLSEWYFKNQILRFSNDKYIHLNPCIDTYSRLPSCYHLAQGNTFKEFLELDNTFDESLKILLLKNYSNKECFIVGSGNEHWCYDEFYATEKIMQKNDVRFVAVPRIGGQSGHRIDRTDWKYDFDKLESGYYYDSHSLRPYSKFKKEIDKLL